MGVPPSTTAPGRTGARHEPDHTEVQGSAGTLGAGQVNPGAHLGTPGPTGLPVIDSPEAAGETLGELFLDNADRGDDAANDHLVAELVRRIRAQQNSRDGGRGRQHC